MSLTSQGDQTAAMSIGKATWVIFPLFKTSTHRRCCRMRSSKRASKGNDSQPLLSREGNLSNSKGRPVKRKPIIRQRKIRRKLFVEPKIQKFSKDTSNGDQMNVMCLFDSGSQRSFVTKLFPVTRVKEHVYISTFNDGDRHEKLRRVTFSKKGIYASQGIDAYCVTRWKKILL
ncbi:hypothetical protein TPS_05896 [Trichinella pseudospiralis]